MEEIRLYDINSIEFSELIDAARVELKNNNSEYKELKNITPDSMYTAGWITGVLFTYRYILKLLGENIDETEYKI